MAQTPAARRYLKRFFTVMLVYIVTVFAASFAVKAWQPAGMPLIALSVLPALPIIGSLIVIGLYLVEETDEYLRNRIVTAMLISVGLVLSISTVLGFLQIYKALGQVDVFWAFPAWCAFWGLAQCLLVVRDKVGGGGGVD